MRAGRQRLRIAVGASALVSTVALVCAGVARALAPPPASEPTFPAQPGIVRGTVRLVGAPPSPSPPRPSRDPRCPAAPEERVLVDKNGNLRNALIRVLGAPATAPPPEPLLLTQEQCAVHPRVGSLVTGQALLMRNADPFLHNVHVYANYSTLLNQAQLPGGPDVEYRGHQSNTLLRILCDVHPSTVAWVWVQPNALTAVTDGNGAFTIRGVPSGSWEVEAWHERFGVKKGRVVVTPDHPAELRFDYHPTDYARYPY